MKHLLSKFLIVLFCSLVVMQACKDKESASNAGNRDTIQTFMKPKADATNVMADSLNPEVAEKDSLNGIRKDSAKK